MSRDGGGCPFPGLITGTGHISPVLLSPIKLSPLSKGSHSHNEANVFSGPKKSSNTRFASSSPRRTHHPGGNLPNGISTVIIRASSEIQICL